MDYKTNLRPLFAGKFAGFASNDDRKTGSPPPKMGEIKPPQFSIFFIMICVFLVGVTFSFIIEVEAVVNGQGSVRIGSGVQSIESQEGGIIQSIAVTQGERVEEGQELAVLANSSVMAERIEIDNELTLLRVKEYRLGIERNGIEELTWPETFKDVPQIIKDDQYDLFLARKQRQSSELQTLETQAQTLKRELEGAKAELTAMVEEHRTVKEILDFQLEGQKKGWVSKADALRSQNQYAQINREMVKTKTRIPLLTSQIQEAERKYEEGRSTQAQQTLDELEEVTSRIRTLDATIQAASDKDERRVLRAPRAGVINAIHVTGTGDLVQPGEPVFDLVPVDQGQIIEARIDPSKRRGLYVGLPAKVSFTALQDLRVAPIDAKVVFVAADTQTDPEGHTYYEIHVETSNASVLLPNGQKAEIEPGMQATVSVVVGSHTLADFLLRPLEWAAQNAFRER